MAVADRLHPDATIATIATKDLQARLSVSTTFLAVGLARVVASWHLTQDSAVFH